MIDDLRRDHDGSGVVDERDLVRGGQHVARFQRHQSPGANSHVLAGRCRPQQIPSQRPVSHVERPFVLGHPGDRQKERLVVHVELEDRGIGHVDDRLSGAGEPVRIFGVNDRPRLVEAVHERSRRPAWSALLEGPASAEVSVGQREEGLCSVDVIDRESALGDAPGFRWIDVLGRGSNLAGRHTSDNTCGSGDEPRP